jgi:hypothetical protein
LTKLWLQDSIESNKSLGDEMERRRSIELTLDEIDTMLGLLEGFVMTSKEVVEKTEDKRDLPRGFLKHTIKVTELFLNIRKQNKVKEIVELETAFALDTPIN